MPEPIRIGTRESRLAVWQASAVRDQLQQYGHQAELVYIKSEGDIDLSTPLYEMGVQGIFTRSLDSALLNRRIDIAVHSMKDVPTQLPQGIAQAAVLERGNVHDVAVYKHDKNFLEQTDSLANIATSSIRRQAQWLHRYPRHQFFNLRGNMQTRLQKLHDENWDAAIFAYAGLDRIGLLPQRHEVLQWMLPAPAQGAIMVVAREGDEATLEACRPLDHENTALCTAIERDFLRGLMGGCSTPVSALATVRDAALIFTGNTFTPDGTRKAEITKTVRLHEAAGLGIRCAAEVWDNGGREIAAIVKAQLKKLPAS